VWVGAGTAYFFPIRIDAPHTYTKAWWVNGGTAAGNVDVGIYTLSGVTLTRVVASTAVAQAGINNIQVATTFTTTTIGPGLYYLAMACSLATATVWKTVPSTHVQKSAGTFQTAAAHPLPATATAAATAAHMPLFGFSELSTF
jgi:hypothetical protein